MNTPLDELQWKSPEWIQAFGLRTDNVLDYFAESPFFEKTSNNHVIKMQRQFSQLPGDGNANASSSANTTADKDNGGNDGGSMILPKSGGGGQDIDGNGEFSYLDAMRRDIVLKYPLHAMFERELCKLRGVEYVLACVREPDFWMVRKQYRHSRSECQTLQDYYIVGANVYQSPSVFKIVQNRMLSASYHLSKTLASLQELSHFDPSQGVQFKRQEDETLKSNSNNNNNTANTVNTTNGPMSSTVGVATAMGATVGGLSTMNNQASPYDTASREAITREMMDRLMGISMRSEPAYI